MIVTKIENPENIEITISATFTLAQWFKILEIITSFPDYYGPLDDLRCGIRDTIIEMRGKLTK